MVMLSTVSGTFSASSAAAQMWCRVQPAGKHSSYWNSLDMRQSWAHSLPLYQREKKHRLKTTWPAKEFCALNLSTSVCWQTPRGKRSMSCSREVHTVPFRKRHFEFGTRPWYIQYPSGVVTPGKGVLKIELQMPIQHGGRERKGQDKQITEHSHLLQLRMISFCLLQAGTLGHECSWHTWEKVSQPPADLVSAESTLP